MEADSYDLVVVGYGAAGAAAALTAARAGARVALVEKQPADEHLSSTRLSGGLIMGANAVGGATTYLDACSGGMIPCEVSRAWAERAVRVQEVLRSFGIESVRMAGGWLPSLDGYESIDVFAPLPRGLDPASVEVEPQAPGELVFTRPVQFGNGQTLHDLLVEAVDRTDGIEPFFGHSARRLVQEDARVVGITCATPAGDTRTLYGALGVVLACGGFERDQEMILNHLKAYPIYFYGSRANTGDGVRMAQAVGADLWHMNQMIGRAVGHFIHPDGSEHTLSLSLNPPGYVIVDRDGRRFANEYLQAVSKANFYYELLAYDAERLEYSRIPAYWIFDERRMRARPLAHGGPGYFAWSKDNEVEVDLGWINQAETVEAVAAAAGIRDPDLAARTVAQYNAACAGDATEPFGRPPSSLVPLDRPPYYCVPLFPGGATTNGGPRRDAHARIVDPFGTPIPGLFGAGELGGAIGLLYPAPGSNLGEAFAFGEIAAETALAAAGAPAGVAAAQSRA